MSEIPYNDNSKRFIQTEIPTDQFSSQTPEKSEFEGMGYYVFLVILFAVVYWLISKYYFV